MRLDAFVVMPDHVHGVLWIAEPFDASVRAGLKPAPTQGPGGGGAWGRVHSLSEVVRGFKTFSARRINEARGTPGAAVWQRGFYEHVVRGEADLDRIRFYIERNPARWAERHG